MKQSIIDLVERSYTLEGDEATWLRGLAETAEDLLPSDFWVAAWTYEITDNGVPQIGSLVSLRGGSTAQQHIMASSLVAPRDHSRSYFAPRVCISLAEAFGGTANLKRAPFWKAEWRCEDLLMIKALDITGRGCMFFAPMGRRAVISDAMETRWRHAMAHVNAGMRVRDALRDASSPADTAEAVLEADGRAVHATGEAESPEALDTLREAIKEIDRCRGAMRRDDSDAALDAWQGLVTGRWSLVDHFDSDGRRYILARRNDPQITDPRALTLQERQIARYAAFGLANKHIAYTLGVSEARVSQALSAVIRKLGLTTRAELVKYLAGSASGENRKDESEG